jgi:ABC-type transport system substrate-binding protein
MEGIILEEAPAIFLWHNKERMVVKSSVQNYAPSVNPFGQVLLKTVRIER